MALVHEDDCIVLPGKGDNVGQRSHVAVHAEDAIGDDEACTGTSLRLLEKLFELPQVAMLIAVLLRLAETDAVDDGGVVQLVGDDGVLGAEENLKDACICVKAARIEDSILTPVEAGNLLLEFLVNVLCAADEAY